MMNVTKATRLDFWSCFYLRNHHHFVFKTLYKNGSFIDQLYNVPCKAHGEYLTGTEDSGRIMYLTLSVLILLVSFIGMGTNILNIFLLKKSFSGRQHFRESLVLLSIVEMIASLATIGITFFTVAIMENLDRSQSTMVLFSICRIFFNAFRTMSVYTTILITIERYLLIAVPVKYNELYNKPWKSRLTLAILLLFSILLNLPWMCKFNIVENGYHGGGGGAEMSDELLQFPYLFERNDFAGRFPRWLQETLMFLDFVAPFPILLIFNALLYRSIHNWTKKRVALSGRQKRDINASKMVTVVVLVLIFCHSVSLIVFATSRIPNLVFIELFLLQRLSVVVSASSNFMVYYWFGPGFQREFWEYLKSGCGDKIGCINRRHEKQRKETSTGSHLSQYSFQE